MCGENPPDGRQKNETVARAKHKRVKRREVREGRVGREEQEERKEKRGTVRTEAEAGERSRASIYDATCESSWISL